LEQKEKEEELHTEQLDVVVNEDMALQLRSEQQEGEGEGEQMWRQQRGQQESYVVQDWP
jgi:hypothetical protein